MSADNVGGHFHLERAADDFCCDRVLNGVVGYEFAYFGTAWPVK